MSRAQRSEAPLPADASQSLPTAGLAPLPLPLKLLIINDDVAIRLHLADLLMPHCPGAVIDSANSRAAIDLGPRLRDYAAAIAIVDLSPSKLATQPLSIVAELRAQSKGLVVTVIGRGGNERSAIEALRAGAIDYWPLHTVGVRELVTTLRSHLFGSTATLKAPPGDAPPQISGYRPVKELARSPQATLYLAESDEVGEPVALKVHRHAVGAEGRDDENERFLRECRLLARINHRGVANVYDFGITDECHWLAMEYFPCGSLKARLQHPLGEAEAVAYATQIGAALAAIHAHGIVHRDLKPANVMLRADDSVALIDFGLARPALRDSTVTGRNVRVGSPSYMAPEQIEGLPPDARCDLYALGVVLYELLTGALPFAGDSVAAVLELHRSGRPPRLPPALARYQTLVQDLLAKRPPDRPASATAFLDALAAASAPPPERRST